MTKHIVTAGLLILLFIVVGFLALLVYDFVFDPEVSHGGCYLVYGERAAFVGTPSNELDAIERTKRNLLSKTSVLPARPFGYDLHDESYWQRAEVRVVNRTIRFGTSTYRLGWYVGIPTGDGIECCEEIYISNEGMMSTIKVYDC